MQEILINNFDGDLTVSSLQVARDFNKMHKNILRNIETLIKDTSAQNCANLFHISTYVDNYGRNQKCYELTRDGFCLLVMGFTGKRALEWKLKYIKAFNLMEEKLRNQNCDISKIVTEAVTAAVQETVRQLMPILKERTLIQEDTHMRRLRQSKIAQLDPALRNLVDDMLLSRKYKYVDIKEFLLMHGVSISITAIGKYKNTLYED